MAAILEFNRIRGFTNAQFKKLDGLFCHAAARGTLNHRAVDCDFDTGIASFTYSKSEYHKPYLRFVIQRTGPGKVMYELYKEKQGRIAKSGVFENIFEKLSGEIYLLDEH